jgi:putative hydrolase of the HAD superfamily
MTLEAVLFDLDETLIRRAIRRFVADQFLRYAAMLTPVTAEQYTTRFLEIEDDGRVAKTVIYPALVKELGITGISADALLADYRSEYVRFTTPSPGALETLRAFRDHGLRTGIITNGSGALQNGKIDAIGIRPLLDCVLVSETVGLEKPDPAIFHRAASLLGIASSDCVFIGDNPALDIAGALGAGFGAIWVRAGTPWPPTQPPPPFTIETLPQALPICGLPPLG